MWEKQIESEEVLIQIKEVRWRDLRERKIGCVISQQRSKFSNKALKIESDVRHREVSWNDFLHRNGRVRLKIAYFISVHILDTYYDTFF